MSQSVEVLTPENSPNHSVVGRYWAGYGSDQGATVIYYCDSYDPACGYWLTNTHNAADRRNVSERAIGRTFHKAEEREDHWYVPQWNVRVSK